MKTTTNIVSSAIALFSCACFAILPRTQAVSPVPDGGYPGGNTAEGQNALFSLDPTIGTYNTAVGFLSLRSDEEGQYNTAVGAGTLLANMGAASIGQGVENTAIGAAALLSNTTGAANTAVGGFALFSNSLGDNNTATGASALYNNRASSTLNTASANTANGAAALFANTDGDANTAIGASALPNNTTGNSNIAIGFEAGENVTTANNVICIGTNVAGNNINDSCYIGNIFGATSSNGTAVFVNSNGRLGTMTSSKRFKQDIKPMDNVSEALYSLKPVSFRYKKAFDPAGASQLGLVAEDVEKVNPDLIIRDKEGKPYTVRYEQINAMLLNEFLKEHRKVEKLEATVAQQQTSFQSRLAEQEMQIQTLVSGLQKVSARVEMSKRATKVASNLP